MGLPFPFRCPHLMCPNHRILSMSLLHGSVYLVLPCKAIHAIPVGESRGAYSEELARLMGRLTRWIKGAREEGGGDAAL